MPRSPGLPAAHRPAGARVDISNIGDVLDLPDESYAPPMIVDANLLLYAMDETSRHHDRARSFLEDALNGQARVGLPWQSLGAFLRISTHPRVMAHPLTGPDAAAYVEDWLAAPSAWMPDVKATT